MLLLQRRTQRFINIAFNSAVVTALQQRAAVLILTIEQWQLQFPPLVNSDDIY